MTTVFNLKIATSSINGTPELTRSTPSFCPEIEIKLVKI